MRIKDTKNEITLKAYAGTTGVLLAFNVTAAKREKLLGFSVERFPSQDGKWEWMSGMMPFPGQPHDPGQPIPTDVSPVQKFRWSDYRVHPETKYRYRVHAMIGTPEAHSLIEGPEVEVTTSSSDEDGEHNVVFNRAAGASQAFVRNFPKAVALMEDRRKHGGFAKLTVDDLEKVEPRCKEWLTRGALPEILGIISAAKDSTWALDIAIYEYEWHEIVEAVNAAFARGAHVRLLYHAKNGDAQTDENAENAKPLIDAGLAKERRTSAIFHDKFVVLSAAKTSGGSLERTPHTVLCGSTNFTHNGLFRQANVVHVVRPPKGKQTGEIAQTYARHFEMLWKGDGQPATPPGETKKWVTANNPMNPALPVFAGFSPRSGMTDLTRFATLIDAAKRDVLFSTAFVLPKEIIAALLGKPNDPILRLGVQNKDDNKIAGFHRDQTAEFAATALMDHGFEGWLNEQMIVGKGNILIHTKIVVVDFTSDHPVIISGSHNLSHPASESNDENYLIIQGNSDIADSYGVEVMRIYDHYRARWVAEQIALQKLPSGGTLFPNNTWTNRYFEKDSLHFRDRLRFVGE